MNSKGFVWFTMNDFRKTRQTIFVTEFLDLFYDLLGPLVT